MKVLALNSSPHKSEGGTGLVLGRFIEGARAAGADVELVHLRGMEIRPCLGCFDCWTRTPGCCVQHDAMDELLPKFAAADTLVYATPLYVDGMNGTMKMFLDRCIPLIEPWFELRENHCRHPRRAGFKARRAVLVSAAGFTEADNFDPLIAHVKAACRNMGCEFAGALVRPYAASLEYIGKQGVPIKDVLDACAEAGRELVETGCISEATQGRVARELVSRALYIEGANQSFHSQSKQHGHEPD
jgi:FMN-dependent NADH-azoreductase